MIEKSGLKTSHRRSIRLKEFDCSQPGSYFVTMVTHRRRCLFGVIVDGDVQLNEAGTVVSEIWRGLSDRFSNVSADSFVVMPNHVHVIVNVAIGRNLLRPIAAHLLANWAR